MDVYKPGQFAKKIGRTVSTLQKWDYAGRLKARRTSTNRRFYTDEDFRIVMGLEIAIGDRVNYSYCHVSSAGQQGDLESQKKVVQNFCIASGVAIKEHLTDIGSGLNYKRKNFVMLLDIVEKREIESIIIAHKDRLVRFWFEWFEEFCRKHETKIVVINHESISSQEEMTKDLLSIIHCFSSRLYGLRKYKKELKKLVKSSDLDETLLRRKNE